MQPAAETILGGAVWSAGRGRLQVRFIGRTGASLGAIVDALPEGPREVSWLRQIHSDAVLAAEAGCSGEGDALTTERHDLGLAIATADCVPVVVGGRSGLAVIHAGWRGIAAGVVARAVESVPVRAAEAVAWIGPSIGPCCYEVGDDVAAQVVAASSEQVVRAGPRGRAHLDLGAAVAAQLVALGVSRSERVDVCTRCDTRWSSYRRDGAAAGRNWTLAWLSRARARPG
jgi:hypothetical protein